MLSNTQKISFKVSARNVIQEGNVFKIANNCHAHKLVPKYILNGLSDQYEYSIVIRIKETLNDNDLKGRLYNNLMELNDLEIMQSLEADADLELES